MQFFSTTNERPIFAMSCMFPTLWCRSVRPRSETDVSARLLRRTPSSMTSVFGHDSGRRYVVPQWKPLRPQRSPRRAAEAEHSLSDLGMDSLKHGKPAVAISYLQRALARGFNEDALTRARIVLNLCSAFNENGNPVKALEHAQAAVDMLTMKLQLNDDDAKEARQLQAVAWYSCCVCFERTGRFGEALRSARRGLHLIIGEGKSDADDDPLAQQLRRAERDIGARDDAEVAVRLPALQSPAQSGIGPGPSPRMCYTPSARLPTPNAAFSSHTIRDAFAQRGSTPGAGTYDSLPRHRIQGGAITFRDPRERFYKPVPDRFNHYMEQTLGPGTYEQRVTAFGPQLTTASEQDLSRDLGRSFGKCDRDKLVYTGKACEKDLLGNESPGPAQYAPKQVWSTQWSELTQGPPLGDQKMGSGEMSTLSARSHRDNDDATEISRRNQLESNRKSAQEMQTMARKRVEYRQEVKDRVLLEQKERAVLTQQQTAAVQAAKHCVRTRNYESASKIRLHAIERKRQTELEREKYTSSGRGRVEAEKFATSARRDKLMGIGDVEPEVDRELAARRQAQAARKAALARADEVREAQEAKAVMEAKVAEEAKAAEKMKAAKEARAVKEAKAVVAAKASEKTKAAGEAKAAREAKAAQDELVTRIEKGHMLTADELSQLHAAVSKEARELAADASGLDVDEFSELCEKHGINLPEERRRELFKSNDADGSGIIDSSEVEKLLAKLKELDSVEEPAEPAEETPAPTLVDEAPPTPAEQEVQSSAEEEAPEPALAEESSAPPAAEEAAVAAETPAPPEEEVMPAAKEEEEVPAAAEEASEPAAAEVAPAPSAVEEAPTSAEAPGPTAEEEGEAVEPAGEIAEPPAAAEEEAAEVAEPTGEAAPAVEVAPSAVDVS